MYATPKCSYTGCAGHLPKHDDCLSEALWNAGPDFWDEFAGSRDEYGAYCALILANEDFTIPADHWGDFDLKVSAGTFVMLTAVSSGAVYIERFDTERLAQKAFDKHVYAFNIWEEANGY